MAKVLERASLYETDFLGWLEQQVGHLRAGRLHDLDVDNIAEELEGLARRDLHELENRLETLILHLLQWDHQAKRRARSWQATVAEQRSRIVRLLKNNPSLRAKVALAIDEVYPGAVQRAILETGLSRKHFPEGLPYTAHDILEDHPAVPKDVT